MAKRMLIDATHAEETRVVVLEGSRLEDFDVETQSRRQLKGNIYLAKVVRVEPSLQAAFVEYGGNRHGFLAFGEIHPDYYQIPVADRQRLLQMQEEEARAAEAEEDEEFNSDAHDIAPESGDNDADPLADTSIHAEGEVAEGEVSAAELIEDSGAVPLSIGQHTISESSEVLTSEQAPELGVDSAPEIAESAPQPEPEPTVNWAEDLDASVMADQAVDHHVEEISAEPPQPPESIGGESEQADESPERRAPSRYLRNYKIQEVIRRRQILLIQVVKEERGTKGAALTTYISLAGRYCVLMPNSPRGGGISRKITSATDRRRLKEVTTELEIPRGMGLIVRTAGANRPKPEIKRDCEYLLRLWDDIRELTLQSVAPALIYEEASLIKRAIRDVYSRDVDDILVDGEDGWKAARDFMRMLMPTHVKKVQLWPSDGQPLFSHHQVEAQLDAMLSPTVQLRSGGYLVINQTEALVAIDVNSGRSTRERGIEETALRTNLEAADETARQLRLRDLAGLIVIDFIDMESKKNNAAVERRMKEALKDDRARIQIGSISHFGLMEISRQRLRPSLAETSLTACTHCGGSGYVRSTESAALHVLRAIEDEGSKRRASEILIHLNSSASLYILNNKRRQLADIEQRYGMRICFAADDTLLPAQTRIDRVRDYVPPELPAPARQTHAPASPEVGVDTDEVDSDEDDADFDHAEGTGHDRVAGGASPNGENATEDGERKRKRRRRRRGRAARPEDNVDTPVPPASLEGADQPDFDHIEFPGAKPMEAIAASALSVVAVTSTEPPHEAPAPGSVDGSGRSRGRRGGRSRRKPENAAPIPAKEPSLDVQAYAGPTPADPFANGGMDIFEIIEMQEVLRATAPQPPADTIAPLSEDAAQPPQPLPAGEPDEPVQGPATRPLVIGEAEIAVEKRRGWWRR
jgi:ribonuclease E